VIIGIAVAAAQVLVFMVTAQLMVKLLAALRTGFERVSQGDFSHRLEITGVGELAKIVSGFNQMVSHLYTRHETLEHQIALLTGEIREYTRRQESLRVAFHNLQRHNQLLVDILGVGQLLQRNLNPGSLLQEIHHRVKNNLQVISSLLNLQAGYVADTKVREIFRESQNRVRSMALVHEKLYRSSDLAHIDLAEYVKNLSVFLFRSYSASAARVALDIQVEDVNLGIDRAVPCGLILNELISNALKHAFPNNQTGHIQVRLHKENNHTICLTVADDGIGFPPDFTLANTDSLGMQLVHTLVEQLDGTVQINNAGGAEFIICFPAALS
jgi:two-component sensor histidine kinase